MHYVSGDFLLSSYFLEDLLKLIKRLDPAPLQYTLVTVSKYQF